ncbi:stage II sporulation protein M [Amycolatopsis sp. OK19-0408]|uniref:Stage II sporulation protein M n=1 Tax=Amycolatopsis iheyensis TaxID=2945988 RepID=A0A9X2SPD0_9PSEU|nr:stage II sporulation protein M [Amycolatopsis iheyensis]MCR6489774.1 stage II sporulation protein M [Amycolatopsis iheyensis]
MDCLRRPFQIIRADLRAYLLVNAFVYGVLLLGMALGMLFPELHAARVASFAGGGQGALVNAVVGNGWLFGTVIFLVNVFPTALLLITLPSLVVPFAGLVVFAVKTADLGITLAPVDATSRLTLIPHSLTLLIEFQAYALVMFGAYLLGRSWLRPATAQASTRRQGYVHGLRRMGRLWLPALALFFIGAVYEAIEIYFLVPLVA